MAGNFAFAPARRLQRRDHRRTGAKCVGATRMEHATRRPRREARHLACEADPLSLETIADSWHGSEQSLR